MTFSAVGRKKIAAHVAILLINIVVLALAARVNAFQEFFFVADLFPLALSVVTLALLVTTIALDIFFDNAYTGRPQFETGLLGILSILWLAFNAFSTARWNQVPFQCDSIPAEFPDERGWCKDLQALKAFVWIEFVFLFLAVMMTLRYTLIQNARGNKHIFKMPLSRYQPEAQLDAPLNHTSQFLRFE